MIPYVATNENRSYNLQRVIAALKLRLLVDYRGGRWASDLPYIIEPPTEVPPAYRNFLSSKGRRSRGKGRHATPVAGRWVHDEFKSSNVHCCRFARDHRIGRGGGQKKKRRLARAACVFRSTGRRGKFDAVAVADMKVWRKRKAMKWHQFAKKGVSETRAEEGG